MHRTIFVPYLSYKGSKVLVPKAFSTIDLAINYVKNLNINMDVKDFSVSPFMLLDFKEGEVIYVTSVFGTPFATQSIEQLSVFMLNCRKNVFYSGFLDQTPVFMVHGKL